MLLLFIGLSKFYLCITLGLRTLWGLHVVSVGVTIRCVHIILLVGVYIRL